MTGAEKVVVFVRLRAYKTYIRLPVLRISLSLDAHTAYITREPKTAFTRGKRARARV